MRSIRRCLPLLLLLLAMLPISTPARAEDDLLFFRQLHADGLDAVAVGQMEGALARRPDHPDRLEILYLLGRSYEALEQVEPMMRRLDEFARALPEDPRACAALYDAARAGARAGLLAEAEPIVDRLLRDYADCELRLPGVLLAARIKRGLGDTPGALQLLSYLIENAGENELLGRALYERAGIKGAEDAAAARPDLEQLKASLPRHPLAGFAALQLAEQAVDQQRPEAARAELDWILAHFEEEELSRRALLMRADLAEAAGDPAAAAADLARLRERYPEQAVAADAPAREIHLLAAAGEGRAASARARDYQAAVGETARSFALLAEALAADDRPEQSAAAWQRAAELDPSGDLGARALQERFDLLLGLDAVDRIPSASGRLLARLTDPEARARHLLALGDYHARAARDAAARRAWERVETDAAGSGLLDEALYRLARQAERRGDWREASAGYARLVTEFGAGARGVEARERGEALERYHRRDEGAAVEKLLALLAEERRQGEARGREFRVGRILLEELKDFPRAADYFRDLALEPTAPEGRAWALLFAGRAALRESERLVLAGEEGTAGPWRERALDDLEGARREGVEAVGAEADLELALLRLAEQEQPLDRLAILDAYLTAHGEEPAAARIYYERGEVYRLGRWSDPAGGLQRALADHERAVAMDPGGEWARKAHLGAGLAALALEDHDVARRHFEALVESAAGRYEGGEARFGLGRIEEARKRFRRALDHFEAYLAAAPTSPRRPRCLIHIGDCHYFLRDWDAAAAAYARVLEEHGDDAVADDARFRLALTAEQRGDAAAARAQLERLLAEGRPRFQREAAWRLGKAAAEAGRDEEAIRALTALRELGWSGAHSAEGGLLLGRLLLDTEDGPAARAHYDSLLARVELGDAEPRARAERIRALLLDGDHGAALAAWSELAPDGRGEGVLAPDEAARVLLAFGRERAASGDDAAALARFDACVQGFPASGAAPWALYESALLSARRRDFDAGLAGFENLAERYPDSAAARRGAEKAGGILYARGEFAAASERYEWALAKDPAPGPDLLYNSTLALEKREALRPALARVQRFLANYPEDERVPEAMMKVGYYLQGLGQYERAVLAYRNAEVFQDREGKARLYFWIGDCFQALGDRDTALASFLKVGYLFGDQGLWGVTATLRAAALYEETGDLPQAAQLYGKVLDSQGPESDFGRTAAAGLERIAAARGDGRSGG